MKLQSRLTLPVFAAVVTAMVAAIAGSIFLVRVTFGTALEEQGAHLGQIAETVLKGRSRGLAGVAAGLARGTSDFPGRAAAERKRARLDVAFLKTGGRTIWAFGPRVEKADLAALEAGKLATPLLFHADKCIVIAGAAPLPDGSGIAVVGQVIGREFITALRELLRAEVTLSGEEHGQVNSFKEIPSEQDYRPSRLNLRTPCGAPVVLTILMPARRAMSALSTALAATIIGGLLILAATMLFHYWTVRRVTRPILDLTEASSRIAAGDLDASLPAGAPAELGSLVRQFNDMATSLKQARERLVHSAKLSTVGEMVAGISHELNNPLSGIIGHAEYLAGKLAPGAPGREEIDVMLAESKRMKRTLAQLRGLIKPAEAEKTVLDLNNLVQDVFVLVKHDAAKTGVKCDITSAPEPITVNGVPDQIRQVLLNLALNAVQAMPDGGTLSVQTSVMERNGKREARLSISDTGRGMSAAEVAHIFEPFYSTKPGSMGLGLAICREILNRHGGTLIAESAEGRGTKMTVVLPAADGGA